MAILSLAVKSLRNRRFTSALTVGSIALSVALLLGVERLRQQSQASFASTISGTDLIVGARSSPVQLLLYSVFRIGNPTNNIRWESYRHIAKHPQVTWSVPISLGDSHRGYRVMGTTRAYFDHFRYAGGRGLALAAGHFFEAEFDAVLGAEVAQALGYRLGDELVIAHGAGEVSFIEHADKPFRVAGILERTGTPVDRTLHVGLHAIDEIHEDMPTAADEHGHDPLLDHEERGGHEHEADRAYEREGQEHGGVSGREHVHAEEDATPSSAISAVLVGLRSRSAAVFMQREINEHRGEPLSAILPGVALQELWGIVGVLEKTLLAISAFVVVVGLSGMLIALLTSLNERRREMAILRSVGARPIHVLGLIVGEAAFMTTVAVALGLMSVYGLMALGQPILQSQFGLYLDLGWPSTGEWILIVLVVAIGTLVGLIPGYRIYRYSLADGMTIRV